MKNLKVLAIDDDASCLKLLELTLKKWGFETHLASSASEAWEIYQKIQPEIVLTDWLLPDFDGIELCKRIRAIQSLNYAYIVFITVKSEKENLFTALDTGADDFLVKPVDMVELRAKLRSAERVIELEKQLKLRIQLLEDANRVISRSNEKMKRDMYAVAKIQASLLPASLPTLPEVEFSWIYRPREELAGDCLNVFRLDENNLAFYVLDVSGSGTPAALLSVSLARQISPFPSQSTLLKQLQNEPPGYRIVPPKEVLEELNQSFPLDLDTQQYFTIFYAIIDISRLEMRYSFAGHPAPVLMTQNAIEQIPGRGFPIGFVDTPEFEEFTLPLNPGDRLFIYSDGISEIKNTKMEYFGKNHLAKSIHNTRHLSLKESLFSIIRDGEDWCQNVGLQDDISLMGVQIKARRGA